VTRRLLLGATQLANWTLRGAWRAIAIITTALALLGLWLVRRQELVPEGYRTAHPVVSWLSIVGGLGLLTGACCAVGPESNSIFRFLFAVGGVGCLYWGIRGARATEAAREYPALLSQPVIYEVRVPKATEWSSARALQCLEQLLHSFPNLIFQISATHRRVSWHIVDLAHGIRPELMEQALRAVYPEAEVRARPLHSPEVAEPFYRFTSYYGLLDPIVGPLLYVTEIKAVDPLAPLIDVLSRLQPGERISYILAVAGTADEAYAWGERRVTRSTIHPLQLLTRAGQRDALLKLITATHRDDRFVYRDQKMLEDKLREKLYRARLVIQVDSPRRGRVVELVSLASAQLSHFARRPYNELTSVARSPEHFTRHVQSADQERGTSALKICRDSLSGEAFQAPPLLILELRELAALWHLPHERLVTPRVTFAKGRVSAPDAVARLSEGIVLGTAEYQGEKVEVRVPLPDRLTHVNIIGKTGTGKSTLLHHLIDQDIRAGRGVAVIDPHGKLVRDVLRTSIPERREQDVVVLDLAQGDYPPPLNPLAGMGSYTGTLKVVGLIERLFAGTERAARMASFLRAALVPLQAYPEATMRDVARMFMDDVFRHERLATVDDPETEDFWEFQYNAASPALRRQIAEPVINRIRPFYANAHLYPMLCHPSALDFRALMRQGKIILISLAMDEEQVPEQERNLIGALLVSRLQLAVSKEVLQQPFFVYIDEVQKFVTTSLNELFSEARKYHLSLVTANQYLGQLAGKTLEAIMGNVGCSIIFPCSPDDASALAAYTRPNFTAQQLIELDRYEAVVKTQIHGRTLPAFSLFAWAPLSPAPDASEREQRIRARSVAAYTPRSRADVVAWLRERYQRGAPGAQVEAASEDELYYD